MRTVRLHGKWQRKELLVDQFVSPLKLFTQGLGFFSVPCRSPLANASVYSAVHAVSCNFRWCSDMPSWWPTCLHCWLHCSKLLFCLCGYLLWSPGCWVDLDFTAYSLTGTHTGSNVSNLTFLAQCVIPVSFWILIASTSGIWHWGCMENGSRSFYMGRFDLPLNLFSKVWVSFQCCFGHRWPMYQSILLPMMLPTSSGVVLHVYLGTYLFTLLATPFRLLFCLCGHLKRWWWLTG